MVQEQKATNNGRDSTEVRAGLEGYLYPGPQDYWGGPQIQIQIYRQFWGPLRAFAHESLFHRATPKHILASTPPYKHCG